MYFVGKLPGQGISVGNLPGLLVGTLQVPLKNPICRNFAYASLKTQIWPDGMPDMFCFYKVSDLSTPWTLNLQFIFFLDGFLRTGWSHKKTFEGQDS